MRKLSKQGHGFAVFPEVRIYRTPGEQTFQHLLFGDYITPPKATDGSYLKWDESLLQEHAGEQWLKIRSRQEEGWIRLAEIQAERTLEVNFVDIGQGDGCHIVTPTDEHFLVDAGIGDNMYRFLRWRFNLSSPGSDLPRFYAMISHPDEDHWKGFEPLLSKLPDEPGRRIAFEKLYYNGIVQLADSKLGKVVQSGEDLYLQDFIQDPDTLKLKLEEGEKKSRYQQFLSGALRNFPGLAIEAVWKDLKKEKVLYDDGKVELHVMGPIPEKKKGQLMLPWFDKDASQISQTKNGHSIVLIARIGKMKVLLGGDLNSRSADYLMGKYGKTDIRLLRTQLETAKGKKKAALEKEMQALVTRCRKHFQVEVAKSCHHGSHDITNELLQSINAIATVISSGDEESYAHPRPETLGAIGKYGRGERPLIFSTELARSSPEFFKHQEHMTTDSEKQRVVSTYGMITLRTDGEKAIIAQKLERPRNSFGLITKWHIDKLIWNDERKEFISKK